MRLVVATRKSMLALAQCRSFVRALCAANPGLEVEELLVVTSGDRIQDRPLSEVGGKGLFVKEIEEALLDGRAQFAVHSMKDLPADQPAGLTIACVPERADPRDVLLVRKGLTPSFSALPAGSKIGSSSLRRRAAIERLRRGMVVEPLRGNVDTRIKKLESGEYDGIVLAAAGLARIGIDAAQLPPHAHLDHSTMLPAVAQGVLAIEARIGDRETEAVLAKLEHRTSRLRAWAERGVLKALGADCTVPLAAHARLDGEMMHLEAWLASEVGFREQRSTDMVRDAAAAEALGRAVGKRLIG